MIRNAQIRFLQNQSFEGKDLTQVGSVVLDVNPITSYPGQLKRGANGELYYIHPTKGIVTIVDSAGNITPTTYSHIVYNETSPEITITNNDPMPGLQKWKITHNFNLLLKPTLLLPDGNGNHDEIYASAKYPSTNMFNELFFVFNEDMVGKGLLIVVI